MGKKNRKKGKPMVLLKTKNDRLAEILDIFSKFKQIDLGPKYPGVDEFFQICKAYVNDGLGRDGKIKIKGEKRIIEYILHTKKNTVCSVNLKYDKHV